MYDTKTIEEEAVDEVRKFLRRGDKIHSEISYNDKTPSWDGNLFLYENNKSSGKSDLMGKIDIQVKGRGCKKISTNSIKYSFEISDLRNYYNDGGVILFVVEVKNNLKESKIYYKKLLPYDLKSILEKRGNQKTTSIKLKELHNIITFEEECQEFILNKQIQMSMASKIVNQRINKDISMKDFDEITVVNFGKSDFFEREYYVYGYVKKYNFFTPIDKVKFEKIETTKNIKIFIDDNIYYESCKLEKTGLGYTICLGKSICIKPEVGEINIKIRGNIDERLNTFNFLLDLYNKRKFSIQNIEVNIYEFNFDIDKLKEGIEIYEIITQIFSFLNIDYNTIKYEELKEKELNDLFMLKDALIDNEYIEVDNCDKKCFMYTFLVQNIKIATLFRKVNENKYKVYDYFSYEFIEDDFNFMYKVSNEKEIEVSPYVVLKDEQIQCDNINYDVIEKSILSKSPNREYLELVNLFVLKLIDVYDSTKNHRILDLALKLDEYILNNNMYEIGIVNKFQIIKRIRSLTEREIESLISFKYKSQNLICKCCIDLILGNILEFNYNFKSLNLEEQEQFKSWPINKLNN